MEGVGVEMKVKKCERGCRCKRVNDRRCGFREEEVAGCGHKEGVWV